MYQMLSSSRARAAANTGWLSRGAVFFVLPDFTQQQAAQLPAAGFGAFRVLRGHARGEDVRPGEGGRAGEHLHIACKAGGGFVRPSFLQPQLHGKACAHVRKIEGPGQRPPGFAHRPPPLRFGQQLRVHHGGQQALGLTDQLVQLLLGGLQCFAGLAGFQVIPGPCAGGVAHPLGQLAQQRRAGFRVAVRDFQHGQPDGGGLPVGGVAAFAHLLQQLALAGPPAGAGFLARRGEEHGQRVVAGHRVVLQGGAAGVLVQQLLQLLLGGLPAVRHLIHGGGEQVVYPPHHLFVA